MTAREQYTEVLADAAVVNAATEALIDAALRADSLGDLPNRARLYATAALTSAAAALAAALPDPEQADPLTFEGALQEALHDYLAPHPQLGTDADERGCVVCFLIARAIAPAVRPEQAVREAQAAAWNEAVEAVAWAQQNGPEPLRYVADHNPYREARP